MIYCMAFQEERHRQTQNICVCMLVCVSSFAHDLIHIYYDSFSKAVTKTARGQFPSKAIKHNLMSADAFLRDTLGRKHSAASLISPI